MTGLPVQLKKGTVREYNRNTLIRRIIKITKVVAAVILLLYLVYRILPNPYLCYGYNVKKVTDIVEFDWTGNSYQCRLSISNSGILSIKNPILHLYFIDGATVTMDPQNKEWQENDKSNYFWAKSVDVAGGIRKVDIAERAWPINIVFNRTGVNRIKYVITPSGMGIQKIGILRAMNTH